MEALIRFELQHNLALSLDPKLQWLWYSHGTNSFITGDERVAYSISVASPQSSTRLDADVAKTPSPFNLPLSKTLGDEFAAQVWHGFRFLSRGEYSKAIDKDGHAIGDLLRTLVFGPDYGLYVRREASGAIISLSEKSLELLQLTADGFELLDKTKTRGKAALAFAAHPNEPMIVYGDNFGAFHAHRFDSAKFGKATKIAEKERKASRLEFSRDGHTLMIGGMGYLATYPYDGKSHTPLHETSVSVRDFIWLEDDNVVLLNQGMHGVTTYRYAANGFSKIATMDCGGAAQQMALSASHDRLAITLQDVPGIKICSRA